MKKIMNSSVFLIIFEHNPSNEMITYLNKKVIMNVKKGKETKAIISTKHPIREANLSTGNINVLLGQGIAYLEDVSAYSEIKLLDLRGFGKKKLYELKEIMNKHDLPFKE
jgi:DNA-directed RNA polymerase alpha subunit